MDLTLLELHFDDAEFNAPFAGRTTPEDEPSGSDEAPAAPDEASISLGPVAVLLAFVGLALLGRYLRGGEAEQSTLDEVEA